MQMGLKHIFSDEADFSGISTAEPMKISIAVQKVFIDVSEDGTEAAAASCNIYLTSSIFNEFWWSSLCGGTVIF